MQSKKVSDIMVPLDDYVTISEQSTLYEAIKELQGAMHSKGKAWHGHRSVMVLGKQGNLVGILTMSSLLRAVGIKELDRDPQIKAESWGWYYVDRMRRESGIRVRDIMRPLKLYTVSAEASVLDVALSLLKYRVNTLPVMDKEKPVGIVRTIDVFMVIDEYFH